MWLVLLLITASVATAQEPPQPIDLKAKLEITQKQNDILRKRNNLVQAKLQLDAAIKKRVEELNQEVEKVRQEELEVRKIIEGLEKQHEGWKLDDKLEWKKEEDVK